MTNNLDAQQTEEVYTNERIYTYAPRLVRMQLDFAREHFAFRLHDFEFFIWFTEIIVHSNRNTL